VHEIECKSKHISSFFEKALVNLVNRLMHIRIVRF
jgi:hypothetical protein